MTSQQEKIKINCHTFTFRLIWMKRPFHYKRSVTKGRLHSVVLALCILWITEIVAASYFFREDLKQSTIRTTVNLLKNDGLYLTSVLNFGLLTLVKTLSFILISVELHRRKVSVFDNKSVNSDFKVTKAISVALGIHLFLYLPAIACAFTQRFVDVHYMIIVMDVCLLLFFMNTLVNPFIYFVTIEDFREGYKIILLCKNINEDQDRQIEHVTV